MSFKRNFLKNAIIVGSYNYTSQGINFLASIIIARLLLPENFGLVGLITVITGFISIFADGGISFAVIRSDYGRTYQNILNNISVFIGIILFVLTILLAYPLSLFYNNENLFWPTIVLATNFIFKSLSLTRGAILLKNLDFKFLGRITLFTTVSTAFLTAVLAYFGAQHWSIVIPQIIASLITWHFYKVKVNLNSRLYPLVHIKAAWIITRKLIGSVIGFNSLNYWARNSDNLIVGKLYGASELGIYTRAYSLLALPLSLITGVFNQTLFPSLKKLKETTNNIEDEYYFTLNIISVLTYPLVFLFILFPENVILILWGKEWITVAKFLPYFGLLIFTQTLHSTIGHLLILQQKEFEQMICGIITSFFLVLGIFLGASISVIGVAQFYALSYLSLSLPFYLFYAYIHVLKFNKKNALRFWIPKIIISLFIWCSLYFNLNMIRNLLIMLLSIYILLDSNLFKLLRQGNLLKIHSFLGNKIVK